MFFSAEAGTNENFSTIVNRTKENEPIFTEAQNRIICHYLSCSWKKYVCVLTCLSSVREIFAKLNNSLLTLFSYFVKSFSFFSNIEHQCKVNKSLIKKVHFLLLLFFNIFIATKNNILSGLFNFFIEFVCSFLLLISRLNSVTIL